MGSGVFTIDDLDGATVRVHELEHHGKTDAGALDLHAGRRPAGIEGLEHARAFLRRDAGAGVRDVDHELGVLFGGM